MAFGAVAHLGERIVRNDEVASSILVSSTKRSDFVVERQHCIFYLAHRN